jgi:hypothetical protein
MGFGKYLIGGYQFIGSPFKLNCFLCLQWSIVTVTIHTCKIKSANSYAIVTSYNRHYGERIHSGNQGP